MFNLIFVVLNSDTLRYLGTDGMYYRYVENAALFQSKEEANDHCRAGDCVVTILERNT
jgi:hypothetical protein